jgi:hypothetical protein
MHTTSFGYNAFASLTYPRLNVLSYKPLTISVVNSCQKPNSSQLLLNYWALRRKAKFHEFLVLIN